MKLQQLPDPVRAHLIEVIAIGSLVIFGVIMVFFGWLKYKDRKKRKGADARKRPKRRGKQK